MNRQNKSGRKEWIPCFVKPETDASNAAENDVHYLKAIALFVGLASGKVSRQDSFDEPKNRYKFALRSLPILPYTLRWLDILGQNPALRAFVARRPRIASKLNRPYMIKDMGVARRLRLLEQHYAFECSRMPLPLQRQLLADQDVVLARLIGKNGNIYSVVLTQLHSFEKEGELSLRVLDAAGNILAALTFSFYATGEGVAAMLIGGLQGAKKSSDHALIKEATKACHGVFPKKLALEALLELARQLGVDAVHAVSKEAHIYNHWRYRKEFQADYNQFWLELGGMKLNEALYALPNSIHHKPLAEVESKKRSEYAKRYALLAEMREQVTRMCAG